MPRARDSRPVPAHAPWSPQLALLECAWPDPLLEQRAAAAEKDAKGRPVFAGLRVRMGVHMGRPNCRRNPVRARLRRLREGLGGRSFLSPNARLIALTR